MNCDANMRPQQCRNESPWPRAFHWKEVCGDQYRHDLLGHEFNIVDSKMLLRRVDDRYRHGGSDGLSTCTSICLRRPNGYRNEAARHSIICLRRLSSNRVVCRRDSSSIESTPFCRAPLFARSPRRRRPNLRPKYRPGAFRRRDELPRRVDTRSLLARLPWPEATLVGPVAFACAQLRLPIGARALAPSTLSIWHSASSSSSSTVAARGDDGFSIVKLSHCQASIAWV